MAPPIPIVNRRNLIRAAAAVGLATIAALFFRSGPAPAAVPSLSTAQAVTATTAQPRALRRSAAATGSFHPWQELSVGPEVGGYRVAEVSADIGDRVRKGDELARLNTDMLSAERAAKRATLSKVQAQLAKARADFKRAQALSTSQLISVADFERSQSEMLSASAEVELATANLAAAELRLRQARVIAPADGVITARHVNIGQIAQVSDEMFRLLREGRIEWRAEIPETLLPHIKKDQPVTIRLADGTQVSGRVRMVAPTVNAVDRTALTYVEIPDPGTARPGMFARGEFALSESEVAMIPLTSVVANDGYSYVFVVSDDALVERRRIEVGQIDSDALEVLSGLAANEKIVAAGAAFLKDGDRVRVVSGTQP